MKRLQMDFLFFPFQREMAADCTASSLLLRGAGMSPRSPQSCHREHFQMFLKPARACASVKWMRVGVAPSREPLKTKDLKDQSVSQLQDETSQALSAPVYVLYHVFCPSAPSRRELIAGSVTSPSLLCPVTALNRLCLKHKFGSNREVRGNVLTLVTG